MQTFIAALLGAAIVRAQISALPPCGITCGLQAANATDCSPITNFNCTCQYANQAIILPILESCLAKSCTNDAQSSAAISAGEGICATVSQTGSSVVSTGVASTSAQTSSAASVRSTITSSASISTAYTGAAAAPTAGVEALMAVAGMVVLAL